MARPLLLDGLISTLLGGREGIYKVTKMSISPGVSYIIIIIQFD
jgi:hypothetical protein